MSEQTSPIPSTAAIAEEWMTPRDICQELQIPEQTFYHWRVKHLGHVPTGLAGTCASAGAI